MDPTLTGYAVHGHEQDPIMIAEHPTGELPALNPGMIFLPVRPLESFDQ
jgi:hypothetical protein